MVKTSVADYWDRFVGTHINGPDHREANQVVRQSQWQFITGNPRARGSYGNSRRELMERHTGPPLLSGPSVRGLRGPWRLDALTAAVVTSDRIRRRSLHSLFGSRARTSEKS
jgi:hypothetical protein